MALTLISKAFAEDQPIPRKYARAGENLFPPLAWSGAPEKTRSFALVVEDPDAPSGTFRHCGIANIPAQWTELAESADTAPGQAPRFYKNDFGNARYDGPQPPAGDRPHRYIFRMAALDVPSLPVPEAAGIGTMWAEAKKHVLAEASVSGTYQSRRLRPAGQPENCRQATAPMEADLDKDRKGSPRERKAREFAAQDVRQGEIILKRRWQRMVFIGGLVVAVLVILLLRFAG